MKMQTTFRTPYNYFDVKLRSVPVYVEQSRKVLVADTQVSDTQGHASFSDLNKESKGFFTNSDVPIKVYGHGILDTHFDPSRQRTNDVNAAVSEQITSAPSQAAAVNAAAAAAASSSNAEIVS